MDLLIDFLLTITGLRLAVEAVVLGVLAIAVVSAMAVVVALWHRPDPRPAVTI